MKKIIKIKYLKTLFVLFYFLHLNAEVVSKNTLDKLKIVELSGVYSLFINGEFKGEVKLEDLKTSLRTLELSDFSLKGILRSEKSHYNIPTILHNLNLAFLLNHKELIKTDLVYYVLSSSFSALFFLSRYYGINQYIKILRSIKTKDILFNIIATFTIPLSDFHYEDSLFFKERLKILQGNKEVTINDKLFEIYKKRLLRAVLPLRE